MLKYQFYKASPRIIIVVLCGWMAFLSVLLTMMQHTNMLGRFCVALGVSGKEKCGKTYKFLMKGSSKICIFVKIVFFFFIHQLTLTTSDRSFPFLSDNAYLKCT